ncbi:MAG: hypothetical protein M3S32_03020, partial [Acidobacteriota bacterium]|nr:hypothetical protein [Acidobacteriota bacterium]
VSQAAAAAESPHSFWMAGTEAEAANHTDMPSSSAPESSGRARHRAGGDASSAEGYSASAFRTATAYLAGGRREAEGGEREKAKW